MPSSTAPDFGSRVLILDPSMSTSAIQTQLSKANQQMDGDQFDNTGYAYLFKPGKYGSITENLDVRVGFYTHVVGLGQSPDDVVITGAVRSKAFLSGGNATCNFWRTAENFAVVPGKSIDNGVDIWAVSQGTAIRRAHVMGSINLSDNGYASGGFIADSKIDDTIDSGPQQQFLTRNDDLHQWQGHNWNMVFVGDGQAPAASWPAPPMTVVDQTPLIREKPFLYLDANGNYLVMVPACSKGQQRLELERRYAARAALYRSTISTSRNRAATRPRRSTPRLRRASICCSHPATTSSAVRFKSRSPTPSCSVSASRC